MLKNLATQFENYGHPALTKARSTKHNILYYIIKMKEINPVNFSRVKFRRLKRHRMTGHNTISTAISTFWLITAENFMLEL